MTKKKIRSIAEICGDIVGSEMERFGIHLRLAPAKGSIYTTSDPAKVAAAGGDLFMPGSKDDNQKLAEGLKGGTVSKQTLQENATRIYRMAMELAV